MSRKAIINTMAKSSGRKICLPVVLVLCLVLLVTIAEASWELPLLPQVGRHHVQQSTLSPGSSDAQYSWFMGRLVRSFFLHLMRWSPFSPRKIENNVHTHHRIVHEYQPRSNPPSTQTSTEMVGSRSEQEETLAGRLLHLRGKSAPPGNVPASPTPKASGFTETNPIDLNGRSPAQSAPRAQTIAAGGRPAPSAPVPPQLPPGVQHVPVALASQ